MLFIIILISINGTNTWAADKNTVNEGDLEEVVDTFFKENMEEYNVPGAAVVVVKNGRVILQKAYGYADEESKKEFDAETTTFRIASITKVFTSTALMQLVEEGKVDLDEDIRTYLPGLKINNPYDKPVTVDNLLTHTSGIDSSVLKELSYDELSMPCGYLLNEINQKNLTVVNEPGSNIEYCSYGVVLQGCIIEAISGMSCKDYINEKILQPMEMTQTVMGMKDENLTAGYNCTNGSLTKYTLKGGFKFYPIGGLISSLSDMAGFMQMYLNGGNYNGQQILNGNTVKDILTTHETYDKILPGMCYGFGEFEEQGVRLIGHGGYSPDGLLSQLDLYPQNNVGTFVIVNQGSNNNLAEDFRKTFISYMKGNMNSNTKDKKMVQSNISTVDSKSNETNKVNDVSGTYRFSDYSKTTLCKGDAFGGVGEITIKQLKDNKIKLSGRDDYTGETYTMIAVRRDSLKYQVEDTGDYLVFKIKGNKIVSMAMTDNSWHGYYEKLSFCETSALQMPVLIIGLLLYLVALLFFILKGIRQGVYKVIGKQYKTTERWDRIRHILIVLISFMYGGFYMYSLFFWGMRLRYSIPLDVKLNLMMPIVGTIGVILFAGCVFFEWIKKKGKMRGRLFDIIFLLISILFLFLFYYWNLLGFQY